MYLRLLLVIVGLMAGLALEALALASTPPHGTSAGSPPPSGSSEPTRGAAASTAPDTDGLVKDVMAHFDFKLQQFKDFLASLHNKNPREMIAIINKNLGGRSRAQQLSALRNWIQGTKITDENLKAAVAAMELPQEKLEEKFKAVQAKEKNGDKLDESEQATLAEANRRALSSELFEDLPKAVKDNPLIRDKAASFLAAYKSLHPESDSMVAAHFENWLKEYSQGTTGTIKDSLVDRGYRQYNHIAQAVLEQGAAGLNAGPLQKSLEESNAAARIADALNVDADARRALLARLRDNKPLAGEDALLRAIETWGDESPEAKKNAKQAAHEFFNSRESGKARSLTFRAGALEDKELISSASTAGQDPKYTQAIASEYKKRLERFAADAKITTFSEAEKTQLFELNSKLTPEGRAKLLEHISDMQGLHGSEATRTASVKNLLAWAASDPEGKKVVDELQKASPQLFSGVAAAENKPAAAGAPASASGPSPETLANPGAPANPGEPSTEEGLASFLVSKRYREGTFGGDPKKQPTREEKKQALLTALRTPPNSTTGEDPLLEKLKNVGGSTDDRNAAFKAADRYFRAHGNPTRADTFKWRAATDEELLAKQKKDARPDTLWNKEYQRRVNAYVDRRWNRAALENASDAEKAIYYEAGKTLIGGARNTFNEQDIALIQSFKKKTIDASLLKTLAEKASTPGAEGDAVRSVLRTLPPEQTAQLSQIINKSLYIPPKEGYGVKTKLDGTQVKTFKTRGGRGETFQVKNGYDYAGQYKKWEEEKNPVKREALYQELMHNIALVKGDTVYEPRQGNVGGKVIFANGKEELTWHDKGGATTYAAASHGQSMATSAGGSARGVSSAAGSGSTSLNMKPTHAFITDQSGSCPPCNAVHKKLKPYTPNGSNVATIGALKVVEVGIHTPYGQQLLSATENEASNYGGGWPRLVRLYSNGQPIPQTLLMTPANILPALGLQQ